jgi:hypothetical protein
LLLVVTVSVVVPLPLNAVGAKLAVVNAGRPPTPRLIDPPKPLFVLAVIVYETLFPEITFVELGVADKPKFITAKLTVPVWLTLFAVPMMFNKYVPAGVELEVVITNVGFPGPLTEGGPKLKPVFVGRPLTLSATVLVKFPIAPTVTLKFVELPFITVCAAGAAATLKSAAP